jgi:naphthalene 1,2-dioxygenase ferredoxin component
MTGNWVKLAPRAAVGADGDMHGVNHGGREIALYNIGGEIYATDNLCTHAFAFLTDGWLDGEVIECPLHAGRFEVKTGKGLGPPIPCDIKTYRTRIAGDQIEVLLED